MQEDALGNNTADSENDTDSDYSTGNIDDNANDSDSATIQLSSLVSSSTGADEPAPVVFSLAELTNQSTSYTSNNVAVVYNTSGNTLTASAGGITVFTFTVDATSGEAVFNLNDQLDHGGAGDDELLHIDDLGQYVTVSTEDADNDLVSTNFTGLIDISVENDIPTLTVSGGPLTGDVQEDALGNNTADSENDTDSDFSTGNIDDNANDSDSATIQLSSLVSSSSGADEPSPVVYGLAELTNQSTSYTSNNVAVVYNTSGNTLTASAGGTTVFTFTVDATSGEAVFNLNDQLDHSGAGDDDEVLHINDLGQYVTVSTEDADNDLISTDFTGLIDISVENDVPSLTVSWRSAYR